MESYLIYEKMVSMSDGKKLYTQCIVPKNGRYFPTIFMRNPYNRGDSTFPVAQIREDIIPFLERGYAVVYQHVRGTGKSEGYCEPYINERQDGLCTLEFIRNCPWYNEEIFLVGGSYTATVHLAYLDTNPKDVKGIVLSMQTNNMYQRDYTNGICKMMCNAPWVLSMNTSKLLEEEKKKLMDSLHAEMKIRPFAACYERACGKRNLYLEARLAETDRSHAVWGKNGVSPGIEAMKKLQIPVLLLEGWYDFYAESMLHMWEELPEATRQKSAFIMAGMYGHCSFGEFKYPIECGTMESDCAVKWFESLRQGTDFEYARTGKVKYYVFGRNQYRYETFPFTGTAYREVKVFPISNTAYRYDPENPVRLDFCRLEDQRKYKKREDIVTYYSEPFLEETFHKGSITATLCVESDCEDTAFFVRISLCDDHGEWNMTEQVCALRYFRKYYHPNTKATIRLEFPNTAFVIKKSQRIRVDVSSSNESMFPPHANTAELWSQAVKTQVATNIIHQIKIELSVGDNKW